MNKLSEFFPETHTVFGVFYPLHCLVAVFRDFPKAQEIRQKLRAAGFAEDGVIAIEGRDFLELEEEETGFVSVIMRELSRFSGTEQISTDHNLNFALEGGALVIVHCPSSESKKKAWSLMEQESSLAAHYYDRLGVDHLAGGFMTEV